MTSSDALIEDSARRAVNALQCDELPGYRLWKPWALDLADDVNAQAARLQAAEAEADKWCDRADVAEAHAAGLKAKLQAAETALEQTRLTLAETEGERVRWKDRADAAEAALAEVCTCSYRSRLPGRTARMSSKKRGLIVGLVVFAVLLLAAGTIAAAVPGSWAVWRVEMVFWPAALFVAAIFGLIEVAS